MKKCSYCGKENQPEAKFCMDCGKELPLEGTVDDSGPQQESYQQNAQQGPQYQPGGYHPRDGYQQGPNYNPYPPGQQAYYERVPSWLAANIVLTILSLFTCSCISLVFGAIGIGFSAQVNSLCMSGDRDGGRRAAGTAKTMFWIGVGIGVLTIIAWIVSLAMGWSMFSYEYLNEYFPYYYENWENTRMSLATLWHG